MTGPVTTTDLRAQLIAALRTDLIGPHTPDERLSDRPTVQYLTGILYPSGVPLDEAENDQLLGGGEEDGGTPELMPLGQTMNPASIGLSFAADTAIPALSVMVTYGLYREEPAADSASAGWQRTAVRETVSIPLTPGTGQHPLPGGGRLEWIVRPGEVTRSITVLLVNRNRAPAQGHTDDKDCLFQPQLRVLGPPGTHPFVHRQPSGALPGDPDLESYQLLYRDCIDIAAGHGCATDWDDVIENRAAIVETVQIPLFELPATTAGMLDGLEMEPLGKVTAPDAMAMRLMPLLDGYASWIAAQEQAARALDPELQPTARVHLDRCRQALARMQAGLELIRHDRQVFEAFRFANQAMCLQRAFSQWAQRYRQSGRRDTAQPTVYDGAWRPFQLAFILLNLPGIAQPDNADRGLVDLLWFPTGGGKTEAYLGLTAFTIALRRLRGTIGRQRGDGGITVIMRYTLRLLTTQQFQRAAALICACEYLRRKAKETWGTEPITIGLWVGANATPNSIDTDEGAKVALDRLRAGQEVTSGNPMQLPFCPWCGEALSPRDYHIDTRTECMVIICPRRACHFHSATKQFGEGIPALLVDDDIYHRCPTLLLATADKFARLPWKPQIMALFGQVDRHCPLHGYVTHTDNHPAFHAGPRGGARVAVQNCDPFLPPELIIQDELHLISGPLGTLSGLYETAIDLLCSRSDTNGAIIRPKVIASTATIRRAQDQVRSLFAREVQLFPPSGLRAGDSFFASEQPLSVQPGRTYLGVYAPGRSVKTALVRVYAILLQVAGELSTAHGLTADAYTTLVGYFNSLRELGGALRLVQDDIVQRIEYLSNQRHQPRRTVNPENCELTSRIQSHKIPEILKLLEQPVGQAGAIDVLLATNMISVGVDVSRLGLMVVNGQPKTSAEYIQATSRVGRQQQAPGLVVTVYNWSRPRDLSHYERFRVYHQAIYRHVEATSVTPFAPRARDKALHAVLIGLARILHSSWAANNAASQFDRNHRSTRRIVEWLKQRVREVDDAALPEVEVQIEQLLDWWQERATRNDATLQYQLNPYQPRSTPVLIHPAEQESVKGSRPTLNSLREVEAESYLFWNWN